jgi:quinoprotein glucose dehydrogenase
MRRSVPGSALGLFASVLCALAASAAGPNQATDWQSVKYDDTANRFSPLDRIAPQNVATLQQVWSFHMKPASYTGRLREDEAIPIVIGNTMYLSTPHGAVHALDVTTGTENWTFTLPNNDRPADRVE